MATLLGEYNGSRNGDSSSRELQWLLQTDPSADVDDDVDVLDWIEANAPATHGGFIYRSARYDRLGPGLWMGTALYGAGAALPPAVEYTYEFDYQAPSEHIYQSLSTVADYAPAGLVAPDFHGAINVKRSNGEFEVQGIDLPPGNATSRFTFSPNNSYLTEEYELYIESIMGTVNSVAFHDRPAGSMRFVSCFGGASNTSSKATISFGFQYSPNLTSIVVSPSITVTSKNGHDLLWAYYEDNEDAAAKSPVKRPRAVYVERVFRYADWSDIGF
jgi:hypothetical protein